MYLFEQMYMYGGMCSPIDLRRLVWFLCKSTYITARVNTVRIMKEGNISVSRVFVVRRVDDVLSASPTVSTVV